MLKEVLRTTEVYVNRFRKVEKTRVTNPQKEKQKARLMLILGIMAKMSLIQYDVILAKQ